MTELIHNDTIDTLLERRSIRKFKDEELGDDIIATLETVAQRAPSSQFLNDWSAIRITDPAIKKQLAHIGRQPYITQAPLLYVFVLDEHRNAAIARSRGIETGDDTFTLNSSTATRRPRTMPYWRCTPWKPPLTPSDWDAWCSVPF